MKKPRTIKLLKGYYTFVFTSPCCFTSAAFKPGKFFMVVASRGK